MGSHSRSQVNYNESRAGQTRLNASLPNPRTQDLTCSPASVLSSPQNNDEQPSWATDSYMKTRRVLENVITEAQQCQAIFGANTGSPRRSAPSPRRQNETIQETTPPPGFYSPTNTPSPRRQAQPQNFSGTIQGTTPPPGFYSPTNTPSPRRQAQPQNFSQTIQETTPPPGFYSPINAPSPRRQAQPQNFSQTIQETTPPPGFYSPINTPSPRRQAQPQNFSETIQGTSPPPGFYSPSPRRQPQPQNFSETIQDTTPPPGFYSPINGPSPRRQAQPQVVSVRETETIQETTPPPGFFSPTNEERNVVSVTNMSAGSSPSQNVIIRSVKETVTRPASPESQDWPGIPPRSPGTPIRNPPRYSTPQIRPRSPDLRPQPQGQQQIRPRSPRPQVPPRRPVSQQRSYAQGQRPNAQVGTSFRQGSPQRQSPPQQGSPQNRTQASFRQSPTSTSTQQFRCSPSGSVLQQSSYRQTSPAGSQNRSQRSNPFEGMNNSMGNWGLPPPEQVARIPQDAFPRSGPRQARGEQSELSQRSNQFEGMNNSLGNWGLPPAEQVARIPQDAFPRSGPRQARGEQSEPSQRINPFETGTNISFGGNMANSFGSWGASPPNQVAQVSPVAASPRSSPRASPVAQPIQLTRMGVSSDAQAAIQTSQFFQLPQCSWSSAVDAELPESYSAIAAMSMNAGESTLAGDYSIAQDEQEECMTRFAVYANKAMDDFTMGYNERLFAVQQDLEDALKQEDRELALTMAKRLEELTKTLQAERVAFSKHLQNMHHVFMKKCKAAKRGGGGKRRETETVVTEPNKVTTERIIEEEGSTLITPEPQAQTQSEPLPPPETLDGTIGVLYANALKEQEERKTKLQEEMEQQLLINPGPETTAHYNLLKENLVIQCRQEQEALLEGYRKAAQQDLQAQAASEQTQASTSTTKEVVEERVLCPGQGEQRRTTTKITTVGSPKQHTSKMEECYKLVDCQAKMREELEARHKCERAKCGGQDPTLQERHALEMEQFNAANSEELKAKFDEIRGMGGNSIPQPSQLPTTGLTAQPSMSPVADPSVTETTTVKETRNISPTRTEVITVTTTGSQAQSSSRLDMSQSSCPPQTSQQIQGYPQGTMQTPFTPESARQVQFASPLTCGTSPAYRGTSWTESTPGSTGYPESQRQGQPFIQNQGGPMWNPYSSPTSDQYSPPRPDQTQGQGGFPWAPYSSPDENQRRCPFSDRPAQTQLGDLDTTQYNSPPKRHLSPGRVVTETTEKKICDGSSVRTEVTTVTTCTQESDSGTPPQSQGGIAICCAEPVRSKTELSGKPCGERVKSTQSMPEMKNACTCNCNKFKKNDLVSKPSLDDCSCPCKSLLPSVKELCEIEKMEKEEMVRSLRRWHIARRDIIANMADGKKPS